jgi:hypothetical protein
MLECRGDDAQTPGGAPLYWMACAERGVSCRHARWLPAPNVNARGGAFSARRCTQAARFGHQQRVAQQLLSSTGADG